MAIAAILLAAGSSRRFGEADKLLAELAGEPLVVRTARTLLASRVADVVAVTRTAARDGGAAAPGSVASALAPMLAAPAGGDASGGGRLRVVLNAEPERGIGSSVATGIRALDAHVSGAMIVPGDMPGLEPAALDRLISAFDQTGCAAIVHASTPDGKQRNPVIWPRRLFAALAALDGDTGGKPLIAAERAADPARVVAVAFPDARLFHDVDRPEDLAGWR